MAWLGFGRMNLTEGGKERKTFPRSIRRLTSQEECMNHQLNSSVGQNLRNRVQTFEKQKRFAINANPDALPEPFFPLTAAYVITEAALISGQGTSC